MTTQEILETLQEDGLGFGLEVFDGPVDTALVVPADRIHSVCQHLRSAHHLFFEKCVLVTGTHMTEQRDKDGSITRSEGFEVMYHLRSVRNHLALALKVRLPADDPRLPSVASTWTAANWHERETYDMLGIVFEGHPNLKRILLPEDWEGFPLRKDYVFPTEYHNISLEVDPPWPTP